MNYVNLPNIALVTSNHFDLRVDCARSISNVEIQAARAPSGKASAAQLRDFFIACTNAADIAAGGTGSIGTPALMANQVIVTDGDEPPLRGDGNFGTKIVVENGVLVKVSVGGGSALAYDGMTVTLTEGVNAGKSLTLAVTNGNILGATIA